jgi:hypothetical protein
VDESARIFEVSINQPLESVRCHQYPNRHTVFGHRVGSFSLEKSVMGNSPLTTDSRSSIATAISTFSLTDMAPRFGDVLISPG